MTDPVLSLTWRHTLPDQSGEDFVALYEGIEVGRFYRYRVSSQLEGQWLWTVFAYHRRPTVRSGQLKGFAEGTARQVAAIVETAFKRAQSVWGVPDVIRFSATHTEAR